MLLVGYVLVAIAIILATVVLLEYAYGFGRSKNGEVVQHGLVFVASTPSGANVQFSGESNRATTNTRLSLVSGNYKLTLSKQDYRPWQQTFTLQGGSVLRLDYAFLIPKALKSTPVKAYDTAPQFATQSPDRRWLLVLPAGSTSAFDLYDLKAAKPAVQVLTLPPALVASDPAQAWKPLEWADDNQHVLLSRIVGSKTEFLLLDRNDMTKSLNLNTTFSANPTKISLIDKKYDQYYLFDQTAQTLQTARLGQTALQPLLSNVLAYQSYGSNVILYASSKTAIDGKAAIDLLQGGKTYLLREVAANTTYLLNLTQYSGSWYVIAGASSENKVYVYKDPLTQLQSKRATLVPTYVAKTPTPTYAAFSASAQFVLIENGSQFSVYDAQYDRGYRFDTKLPLDTPQQHASWMDSNRITYVSGGKVRIMDFDGTNQQTLVDANAAFAQFFSPDYKYLDTLSPQAAANQTSFVSTPLRTPADL